MNYIVYDLEATCWEEKSNNKVQEIIEIGALKVDRFGEVLDSFERFVRPIIHPNLSKFCQQLTTIDQVSINRARTFHEVVEDFQEWIGIFEEEDYLLCSWGGFDKRMLIQDSILHDLDPEWAEQHINIRKQYHAYRNWRTFKGLKKVVELEGYEFTGIYHRGISDAQNLAKIFIKHIDEWQY